MEFRDLSRRGLIKLNQDYDEASKGDLKSYLEMRSDTGTDYEEIKPYEKVFEHFEELGDQIKEKGDVLSKAMANRMAKAVDNAIKMMEEEINRSQDVFDEQEDDDSYSNEDDDDDDEE